jgi:hypothetical protein
MMEAGVDRTEIAVRVDGQLVYSQSLRAGRATESAVLEAAQIALHRAAAVGVPERVELRREGAGDEALARRLSEHIGLPVVLVDWPPRIASLACMRRLRSVSAVGPLLPADRAELALPRGAGFKELGFTSRGIRRGYCAR